MIQARVKKDYRFGSALQAFSRLEFTKTEWRDVPAQFEEQARAHEFLEVRERPVVEAGAIETVAPAVKPTVKSETVTTETLPTSEQLLDQMLAEMPGEESSAQEEVKETRRDRGGKRG